MTGKVNYHAYKDAAAERDKLARRVAKLARRVAKLEKRNAELLSLLGRVWARWDTGDTADAPALALDIALAFGDKTEAQYIAHYFGHEIASSSPGYASKVAKILSAKKGG
jgi:hypothetical protein